MPRHYHHPRPQQPPQQPPPPPPPQPLQPLPMLLPVAFLLSLLALLLSAYLLRLLLLRLRRSRSAAAAAAAEGIDAAAVEAMFPVTAYGEGDGEECAVCLTTLGSGDGVRVLRGCGHVFHPGCIDPWLKVRPTCPVCRSTVQIHFCLQRKS